MIVVDTNLIVYLLVSGEHTHLAEIALRYDPDWVAPQSWRAEFFNVLSTYCRKGQLSIVKAVEAWEQACSIVHGVPIEPEASRVLQLSVDSRCSGYDCVFIAVALMNSLPLVTFDKQLLAAFKETAIRPDQISEWFSHREAH